MVVSAAVPLAQLVFRVSFPIHRRVRLRPIHSRKLAEFCVRLVIAVFIERFASVAIELVEPLEALLFLVFLFLFPVAKLLLAIAFLLRLIARFLSPILAVLVLACRPGNSGEAWRCRSLRHPGPISKDAAMIHTLRSSACPFSHVMPYSSLSLSDSVAAGAGVRVPCFFL